MKIPEYTSKLSLTTQSPMERRSPSEAGVVGRALSQAGNAMTNFALQLKKVNADQELAKANIAGYGARTQITLDASQDNDFDGFEERYQERLKEEGAKISSNIKDRQAKETFNLDYEYKSVGDYANISRNKTRRFVSYDKTLMSEELQNAKKRLFLAEGAEKTTILNELASIVQRRKENLTLSGSEASKVYRETMEGLGAEEAKFDIYQKSPEIALNKLNSGEYGLKEADPKKWASLKSEAERKFAQEKTKNAKAFEEAQEANAVERVQSLASGTLQIEDIENDIANGYLSVGLGSVLKGALLSPKIYDPTPKGETFLSVLDRYLDEDENILPLLEVVTKEFSNGTLDDDDFGYFIGEANKRFNKEPINPWLKNAVEAVKNYAFDYGQLPPPYNSFETAAKIIKELIKTSPKDPEEAIGKLIENQKKEMYPGYKMEDLEFTAKETGLTIKQVYEALEAR